jgi:hypothetical protein
MEIHRMGVSMILGYGQREMKKIILACRMRRCRNNEGFGNNNILVHYHVMHILNHGCRLY